MRTESERVVAAGPAAVAAPQAPGARASLRFGWVTLAVCVSHLVFAAFTQLRPEHLLLDGLFIALPWVGARAERFTRSAFPLYLTALMFDSQRFLHSVGRVHTGDMYRLDALLFPAGHGPTHVLAWAERLSQHPTTPLDFLCGLAYMLFLAELIGIAIYLYVRGEHETFSAIAWCFFLVNLVGVLAWLFLPVAPPWYVLDHGFGPAMANPVSSAAGCARFDALLHIHFFAGFYGRNPNVYGAMPSLHVAYPAIAVWYTWRRGWGYRVGTLIFALWMGFSAVYLAHHYVLDVLAGYAAAVLSCWVADGLVWGRRSREAAQRHKPEPA